MPKNKSVSNSNPQFAKTVDEYIECVGGWRAEIVSELRELVNETIPMAEEVMAWGQVVYEFNGPLCFIKAFRNQVNIGFWRGDKLSPIIRKFNG